MFSRLKIEEKEMCYESSLGAGNCATQIDISIPLSPMVISLVHCQILKSTFGFWRRLRHPTPMAFNPNIDDVELVSGSCLF